MSLSPDGRFVAYTSDESGRTEVYLSRFPEMSGPHCRVGRRRLSGRCGAPTAASSISWGPAIG